MKEGTNPFLAQRIFLMISGLLFGGLITVGFLVTPSLFFVLADKSPCARASEIALMTAGLSTDFKRCNSSFRRSAPILVIGIVLIKSTL